jgi:putative ferrous iron transport protein C
LLTDLKSFLADRHAASLSEMARHFSMEADALRPMLDHWIRKGKVRRSGGSRCQGCIGCAAADVEIYEWVRPMPDARVHPADTTTGETPMAKTGETPVAKTGETLVTRTGETPGDPI